MRPGAPPALWEARPSRPIRNSHGLELPQAEGAACLIGPERLASELGRCVLVAPAGRRSPCGPRPALDLASLPEVIHEDLRAALAALH